MDPKLLRIVYMGTPDFAVAPLQRLVDTGYNIVGVITTPDKPSGRGLKISECAVKRYAMAAGLKILQPEKLKAPEFVEEFRTLNADIGIVIAFRMLPEMIWSMPRLGTFNLHASLLPMYRGAAPINWAIINGESQTGITTFMLNHEIDKGDILCRSVVEILDNDNVGTLHNKLMTVGTELVVDTIEKIATNTVQPISQLTIEPAELKSAPKIFKDTCLIDWSIEGDKIHNLVRGLSPYPAAFGEMKKDGVETLPVKIFATNFVKCCSNTLIGTISSDNKSYIKVTCADGQIEILELQVAGKKRMTSGELLRGFKDITSYRF